MDIYHLGHHLIHFKVKKDLKEIYLSMFIRTLAISMIGIFVPIYLLKEIGYSLVQVFYFYILFAVFFGVLTPFAAKLSSKIGSKHSILLSVPFYLGFYVMLYSLTIYNWSVYSVAAAGGAANAVFWIAFHTDFAKNSSKRHRGEQIGIWYSIATLISLFGPVIGGVILSSVLGFKFLFLIVGILLVGATIPLFFSKDIYEPATFSLKYIFRRDHFKDAVSYIGAGMKGYGFEVLWPIFIFSLLGTYLDLGIIASVAATFGVVFMFIVGRYADVIGKSKLIRTGSILNSITWFVLIFARTIEQVFGVSVFAHLTSTLVDVPFNARVYDKASKSKGNLAEYFVFREIMLVVGRVLLLGLVILIGTIGSGFVLTGFASLLHMLL